MNDMDDHDVYCRQQRFPTTTSQADDTATERDGHCASDEAGDQTTETGVSCFLCNKMYKTKFNMNRHLKLKHGINATASYRSIHCPVSGCFCNFNLMSKLRNHIFIEHKLSIENARTVHLKNEAEFDEWKLAEERSTLSKYVKRHGRRVGKSKRCGSAVDEDVFDVQEYTCNRSGFHESAGRGLRRLKMQGSVKINAMCPSTMTVYIWSSDGRVEVNYFPTHVGHDRDLEHLTLSRQETINVERLVADRASVDSILDVVRHRSDYDVKTEALFADDLKSAESVYDLMVDRLAVECSIKGSYPKLRVAMLISELQQLGVDNPLLDDTVVTDDELLVFIMSAFQAKLLAKFAKGGVVCIDCVASSSCENLFVTSVSVILTDQSAFPCAFCIHVGNQSMSPASDTYLFRFLKAIRERTSRLEPNILLTNDPPQLQLDSWKLAMGNDPPIRQVISPWVVDRDYRLNLWRASKKLMKQAVIYKSLHRLLHESDRVLFNQLLKSFVRNIADRSYGKLFLKYFKHAYTDNEKLWAYSFQHDEYAEQCANFKVLHSALTAMLADCRAVNVDVVFHVIFRLIRGRSLLQTSLLHDDEIEFRTMNSSRKHVCSLIDVAEVVDVGIGTGEWLVRSTDKSPGDYMVYKVRDTCPVPRGTNPDCGIRCAECDLCAHNYLCTCVDNVVRGDICKHVHIVAKMIQMEHRFEIIVMDEKVDQDSSAHIDVDEILVDIRRHCNAVVSNAENVDSIEKLIEIRNATRDLSNYLSGGQIDN